MAIVSPLSIAITRNAVFTKPRSGRPNEIFDSPQTVGSESVSLQ